MEYIVANENKFGYIVVQGSLGASMVVMAVDYMAGGDPLLIGHRTYVPNDQIREATQSDKDKFNVHI